MGNGAGARDLAAAVEPRGRSAPAGGLHVAFLGMDGIGKSSMTRLLIAELEAAGVPVKAVSWRDQMVTEARPNVRSALQELWVESWRLIFLGGDEAGAIPRSFGEFVDAGWEERLVNLNVSSNPPAGPLASAWLDLCGQTLVHYEAIQPLRDAGAWVIEESFGVKIVYKELLSARALARDPGMHAEIELFLSLLPELYRHRAPDLGILVSGPVELAYRWRMAQAGTGSMEDGGTTGQKGEAGFAALQEETDRRFREMAVGDNWLVFEMEDAPPEANFARLRAAIRDQLRLDPNDPLLAPR